jgi:polysaccharide deacetylase family protein (PEP-CTERM system associated)
MSSAGHRKKHPVSFRRKLPGCFFETMHANLFTVDLEEWFHVCGVGGPLAAEHWDQLPSRVELTTHRVLDLLDRAAVPATFFVVGWVAARYPRLIERIRSAGHEIGSHGYAHERAFDLGPERFRADVRASVGALQDAGAGEVRAFRAPEWSINHRSMWALPVLAEEGFTIDASMAPLKLVGDVSWPRRPHVRGTPAGSILEVPPLVADRFGQVMPMGWGWGLRMSSPVRVLRAIEAANVAGSPAALTLHPWEVDPDPPRVRLPLRLRFAHYFRLNGGEGRLQQVLSGTTFGRLSALAGA